MPSSTQPTSYPPVNTNDYREYLGHRLPAPLVANQAYYAAFQTNIAPRAGAWVSHLGVAFSTRSTSSIPGTRSAYTGHGRIFQDITVAVNEAVPHTPQPTWTLVQGGFTATGNETHLLIGNFESGYTSEPPYTANYGTGPGAGITAPFPEFAVSSYYFIDDVVLQAMPIAGADRIIGCGQSTSLGTCALPAISGTTYSWSPTTGLTFPGTTIPIPATGSADPATATPTLTASAGGPTLYTLTVTLPNGQTYPSTVTLSPAPQQPLTVTPGYAGPYCANAPLALAANGGVAGATYTWTWTAPTGPMTVTGPNLLVSPGITTTYTLTSGCLQTTFRATISGDCCYLSQVSTIAPFTQLNAKPFIYNSSPFTGPPGTYYYVPGTLRLENVSSTLPVGSVLLVDGGITSNVELGKNAELIVDGGTITAACDEMWGGIIVEAQAIGLHADDASGEPVHISDTYNGIVLNEPDPAYPTPYFHLENIRFDQNRQSVELHRLTAPALTSDYIIYSTFDSDPTLFKKPWKDSGPDGPHYSLRHIGVVGDIQAANIRNNTFQHTLFGVSNLGDPARADIRLVENDFRDCYLAGVVSFVQGKPNSLYYQYDLQDNNFTFPREKTLPQTPQVRDEVAKYNGVGTYPEDRLDGTFGLYLNGPHLKAVGNHFAQADSTSAPMDNYSTFATVRPRQTGIYTNHEATVNSNSFYLLDTGVRFTNIAQDYSYEVQGNGFLHCRAGLELYHGHIDYSYVLSPAYRILPDAVVNLGCNTFRRVDGTRKGTSIGVYIPYQPVLDYPRNQCFNCPAVYFYPGITFDDPAASSPNTTYMKNWFDDASVGSSGTYIAFQNDQNYTLKYFSYSDPSSPLSNPYIPHDNALSIGLRSFNGSNLPNTSLATTSCSQLTPPFHAGIPRGVRHSQSGGSTAVMQNSLAQNWPNPATGSTAITYQLKAGTLIVELLLRRATDGREMTRVALDSHRTTYELNLKDWPSGTYFATLLVDGVPGSTRRVVVE